MNFAWPTTEQRIQEANARAEAAKQMVARAQAEAAKLKAQLNERERKLRTRQAVILGTWLQRPEYDTVRSQIIGKLTRPQDREAFGLDAQQAV